MMCVYEYHICHDVIRVIACMCLCVSVCLRVCMCVTLLICIYDRVRIIYVYIYIYTCVFVPLCVHWGVAVTYWLTCWTEISTRVSSNSNRGSTLTIEVVPLAKA